MKICKIIEPEKIEIEDIPIPEPKDNELLIKVMASGICGTDIHIFRGEYIGNYPVIPGHEFSGTISKIGKKVARFKINDRVAIEPNISCDNCFYCLNNRQNFCENWQAIGVTRPGGMAQYTLAPEKAVFNIGNLSFEQAAFVEPLSCVLHGLEKIKIAPADRIIILGAGPIGMLLMKAAKAKGALNITMVDKNRTRIDTAKKEGTDLIQSSIDKLESNHYDIVMDATGAIPVMERAIEISSPGGQILFFGVAPAEKLMKIEPFKIFKKGLSIFSSFTSVRNTFQAISLLNSGKINPQPLISHRLKLEELRRGIELIERSEENVMKVLVLPNRGD